LAATRIEYLLQLVGYKGHSPPRRKTALIMRVSATTHA
jgi:hypothetical protein